MGQLFRRATVVAVLAFFLAPLGFVFFYDGLGGALFGLLMIGCLIVVQVPIFLLLGRAGLLPSAPIDRGEKSVRK